ncbi:hypothetical protein GCM10009827_113980 [Dactylosporangium maewongense]|uniref:Uncharacterized protein n=1 Tax=Dactylosporangium maewongense TaxID=634393 RepID=A0ABN2DAS3_9ACTN
MAYRLQRRLVDEFAAWGSEDEAERDRIAVLLRVRAERLERPDPTRWRSGDVHDLLMNAVVSRQVDAWGLAEHGVGTVREFLRFLDATDRLHPASAKPAALLKEADRLTAKFPAAMADTNRWELAKRIFTAMLRDGVRPDGDPAEIDAWAAKFSARQPEERREVLGRLMEEREGYATGHVTIDGGTVTMSTRPPQRTTTTAPDQTNASAKTSEPAKTNAPQQTKEPEKPEQLKVEPPYEQVRDSALLRDLAALAGWVGVDGRPLDDRGELRKADRPALLAVLGHQSTAEPILTPLWLLAIEFDVIQLRRTRVVRGPGAALVDDVLAGKTQPQEALDLWVDLADALIHPITPLHSEKGTAQLRQWIDPWTPLFLDQLAVQQGKAELEKLTDQLIHEHGSRLPARDPDLFAGIAATAVRNTLASLARHGAVAVAGFADDPEAAAEAAAMWGTAPWAVHPEPGVTVELTDLGRCLLSLNSAAAGP